MQKNKSFILLALILTALVSCSAKIENLKTETFKVYGNCGMCKKTIEKAVNKKGEAKGEWNKDTKIISLTYDSIITTADVILKRIADVGYDNEKFLATTNTYDNLHSCCKYERSPELSKLAMNESHVNHEEHDSTATQKEEIVVMKEDTINEVKNTNAVNLSALFKTYIALKDALVKTNAVATKQQAEKMQTQIAQIDMASMEANTHSQFMKVQQELIKFAKTIANTNDIEKQRTTFTSLSETMYSLMKVSKAEKTIYYQHCPMYNDGKGANWLSMEKEIKNPYYGSQMLNCGSVKEVIK